jgi:hypothetical protein
MQDFMNAADVTVLYKSGYIISPGQPLLGPSYVPVQMPSIPERQAG